MDIDYLARYAIGSKWRNLRSGVIVTIEARRVDGKYVKEAKLRRETGSASWETPAYIERAYSTFVPLNP